MIRCTKLGLLCGLWQELLTFELKGGFLVDPFVNTRQLDRGKIYSKIQM